MSSGVDRETIHHNPDYDSDDDRVDESGRLWVGNYLAGVHVEATLSVVPVEKLTDEQRKKDRRVETDEEDDE